MDSDFPWRKIHEYFLELSLSPTLPDLMRLSHEKISELIPYDNSVGVFDFFGQYLSGKGFGPKAEYNFNQYYRFEIPHLISRPTLNHPSLATICQVHWADFADSEFVTDFARPHNMGHTLGCFLPNFSISLMVQRSNKSRGFSAIEEEIIKTINPMLNNLYWVFKKLSDLTNYSPDQSRVIERFPSLTAREAEIICLIIKHLTSAEIAARLCISKRTVEKHREHIQDKIGRYNRDELQTAILAVEPNLNGNFNTFIK